MSEKPIHILQWYGSKTKRLKWFRSMLPKNKAELGFADVFCGSGVVGLNLGKDFSFCVLNDIDREVTNFFEVLQDRNDFDELMRRLSATPHSRAEYAKALKQPRADRLDRAWAFYVRCNQSMYGTMGCRATLSSWQTTKWPNAKAGISWFNRLRKLPMAAEIIERGYTIDTLSFENFLAAYDRPEIFFYCDPPYLSDERNNNRLSYNDEFGEGDHRKLAVLLKAVKGKVMLSHYDSPRYREWYSAWLQKTDETDTEPQKKGYRECLYLNYEPEPELRMEED